MSNFTFGEDGDILKLDIDNFDAYDDSLAAVIINADIAAALEDLDTADGAAKNYIVADTSANLAGLNISADTGDMYLVYETDTGNLYAVGHEAFTAAALIGSLGVGTLHADNFAFQP